jgi:hypothetical protein
MAPSLYAPTPNLLLVGKGALWFDRFDASGALSGAMISLGNCDKFGITVKPTVIKNYTSLDSSAALYDSAVSQVDLTLTIEGFEFGPDQMALVSQAAVPTAFTQGTATVSAEVLAGATVQKSGRGFRTVNREISALVVTQSTTTLVSGTDYLIKDAHSGFIYFPEGSSVVNTASVTVAYTAAAIAAAANMSQLLAASVSQVKGKLFFYADPMRGPNWDVEVPRVLLTGGTEVDFIGTTYAKWKLAGDVLSNVAFDPTIPYYRQTRRA